MTYNAAYFIKKFEEIPENEWCVGSFGKLVGGRMVKCALGHCDHPVDVYQVLKKVTAINDGKDPRYTQPTPKQRILAALRDVEGKDAS